MNSRIVGLLALGGLALIAIAYAVLGQGGLDPLPGRTCPGPDCVIKVTVKPNSFGSCIAKASNPVTLAKDVKTVDWQITSGSPFTFDSTYGIVIQNNSSNFEFVESGPTHFKLKVKTAQPGLGYEYEMNFVSQSGDPCKVPPYPMTPTKPRIKNE